jgi:hypothetical protein
MSEFIEPFELDRADLARALEAAGVSGGYTRAYCPFQDMDEADAVPAVVVGQERDLWAMLTQLTDALGGDTALKIARSARIDSLGMGMVVWFANAELVGPEQGPGSVRVAGEGAFDATSTGGGTMRLDDEVTAWEYARS